MKTIVLNFKELFAIALFCFVVSMNTHAQVYFIGGGVTPTDLSSNGQIVVGDNGAEHFMWMESVGVTLIGGVAPQGYGGQTGISGDGSLITGTRINPTNNLGELSSYDIATQTWTSHGSLGSSSGNSASSAWGVSSDGTTIVGLGWVSAGSAHAIKWTSGGGIEDLGSSVPNSSTRANTANNDGTIIGGWQDSSTGFRQGAIWTNSVQSLITHPNGDPATEVGSMSDDGIWAGGGQGFANNFQAWKWSQATGVIDIGPAPVSGWRGAITGFSYNGEVSVGFYRPWPAPATFGRGIIYTDGNGLLDLTDYAISLGIDVQGAILALPLGISDDGSTVVGLTNSGAGFVLRLPIIPSNNDCNNAIALQCGEVVPGSTQNATDSGGNSSPDVFFTYTGSGSNENITVSLCDGNTNYDSYVRVFTDCTLTNEIVSNNDFCGIQSELTFESDGASTYFIMVEGNTGATGDFSLEVICEPILGIEDLTISEIILYPNPVINNLNIVSNRIMKSISINNVLGQELITTDVNALENSIDLSGYAKGNYFLNIHLGDTVITKKIIKE